MELMQTVGARLVAAGVDVRAEDPGVKFNSGGLPGISLLKDMIGGLLWYGLLACVAGLALSIIATAAGSWTSNSGMASNGKKGIVTALACSVFVGAANFLVGNLSGAGSRMS